MADENVVNGGEEPVDVEVEVAGIKNSNENTIPRPVSPYEMHGRRQIFTSEEKITDGNVLEVLNKALPTHLKNRSEIDYLEKYVRGIQPILYRVKQYNAEINNKVVVNIANQIVTFKASEFAGEPIQYISRGSDNPEVPDLVAQLNDMMMSEGKQTKDLELAHKMFTGGVGYRLTFHNRNEIPGDYLDEAPFETYVTDSKNSFVVRLNDVSKRVVMGVTFVFTDDVQSKVLYTVHTDRATYRIEGTLYRADRIVSRSVHNFGMVALTEYPCNPNYMGAFESVLPMLDAINLTQSNRLDGIEQFIQALMVFDGVDISREDFLELKDLGAIKLPATEGGGSGKKLYYLNEQLDQSQTQTLVNDMYQTILQIVGMPSQGDASSGDSSNNGAVIMKNGWWHAEARALETQAMWKASETEFLKIALKICSDTNKLDGLRLSDLEPRFWRQSYEDLLVKTQSFSTLRAAGMPAIQAFTFSHLSRDPESDAIVYDDYQERLAEELDRMNGVTDGLPLTEDDTVDPTEPESVQAQANTEEGGGGKGEWAICPVCGKRFQKKTPNQKYSSISCANRARRSTPRYGGLSVGG